MATKSENADIAVLQTQMKTVSDAVIRIETKLDSQAQNLTLYVTQKEFDDYKQSQNVQKLLLAILMLFIGALIGFFINTVAN